jgi:hypothetical protein
MKGIRMSNVGCVIFSLVSLSMHLAAAGRTYVAGYTTDDEQLFGPSLERIANDTLNGIHIAWKDNLSSAMYNFFDRSTNSWRWPEGIAVFPRSATLGNVEINPWYGTIKIAGTYFDGGAYHAIAAEDTHIGSGDFVVTEFEQVYNNDGTVMALDRTGGYYFLALRHDSLIYNRGISPVNLGQPGYFPTHNFAGSTYSSYFIAAWTGAESSNTGRLYYRHSTAFANSWRDTIDISPSIPSPLNNAFLGAYVHIDQQDQFHIVANTYDGANRYSSAIWHYCLADTPAWSMVCAFQADSSSGALPPQALIAGRPSLGENPNTGDLFAVWEQFDPANVEPLTGIMRSDIWAARSQDGGRTWNAPARLTEPDNTSKRFPNLARLVDDSLHIEYLADSISGDAARGQGRATRNPVIYLQAPASIVPEAVTENGGRPVAASRALEAEPNPMKSGVRLQWRLPAPAGLPGAQGVLRISDCTGRIRREWPVRGGSASSNLEWDGRDRSGNRLAPGVYFCTLLAPGVSRTIPLVLL